jgi:hypothetical protein
MSSNETKSFACVMAVKIATIFRAKEKSWFKNSGICHITNYHLLRKKALLFAEPFIQ